MIHQGKQSYLSEEVLQQLVALLPPSRLRERYLRQLSVLTGAWWFPTTELVQAEAQLVVVQYQLKKVEPEAAIWLIPELRRLEDDIQQLRSKYQRGALG